MSLLLLFPSSSSVAPTVVTDAASSVDETTATLNGTISNTGGSNPTIRGFQYGLSQTAEFVESSSGSFSTGAFSANIENLMPNKQYWVRAFATNTSGTSYGDWVSFTTEPATYSITINGINRTRDVINRTLKVEDVLDDQVNTCTFNLMDLTGNGIPETDQEIIIMSSNVDIFFAGYITKVTESKKGSGEVLAQVSCVDYSRLLDRNLVHKSYQEMTDQEIIQDIVDTYCAGSGITTNNVGEGATIDQISFNYLQPSQCLRKLSELTGRHWYIDYEKDIHYIALTDEEAPIEINEDSNKYTAMRINKDATQLKNRIYVRGGTKLSDPTTYEVKGDGVVTKFILPDKPHDVTVEVNGVEKTVGIKNVDSSGFDFYLNFQEKYLEQDSGGAVLSDSDTLTVTYSYDIPILVAQENAASILENGVKEFAIFDKSITTTDAARDRAIAELTDYANDSVEGSFETFQPGLKSGQSLHIDLPEYDVDDDYIIKKVSAESYGAGLFRYSVTVANAKKIGIIKFLIMLLEANKSLIELDDNEVVDELFILRDSLLADSLLDSLVIDSAGPYRTWASGGAPTPATRMRWNLFQWK